MKTLVSATVALVAASASLITPSATAGPPVDGPNGSLCNHATHRDPRPGAGPNQWVGEIHAGPATTDVPGTLVCTVQVAAQAHDGADTLVRSFASDANGMIAGAQTVAYTRPSDGQEFLCTSFDPDDPALSTIYYTSGDEARWHTDPSKSCDEGGTGGGPSDEGEPRGLLCGHTGMVDPNPEADANDMTGELHAGPATTDPYTTMICATQIGASTHDGFNAAVREFPSDNNGVIAGLQAVSYSTAEDAQIYLCTSFRKSDGSMIYYTPGDNGGWHSEPWRECSAVPQAGAQDAWDLVDGELCPRMPRQTSLIGGSSTYIDAEGDVFVDANGDGIHRWDAMADLFYDCPVHTFTIDSETENPDDAHDAVTNQYWQIGEVIDCAPYLCPWAGR